MKLESGLVALQASLLNPVQSYQCWVSDSPDEARQTLSCTRDRQLAGAAPPRRFEEPSPSPASPPRQPAARTQCTIMLARQAAGDRGQAFSMNRIGNAIGMCRWLGTLAWEKNFTHAEQVCEVPHQQ